MSFTLDFTQPYLDETPPPLPNAQYFPVLCPITIGGHAYAVDTNFEPYRRQSTRHTTMDSQREGIDTTNIPGEGTVSPDLPWRRTMYDWSLGAGQPYLDRKLSAPNRFFKSKGVDPWVQWNLTLLPQTKCIFSSTGPVQAIQAGAYVYVIGRQPSNGLGVYYSNDLETWSFLGGSYSDPTNITSDGSTVWIACGGSGGIWQTTVGSATATQYVTSPVSNVFWAGSYLMASNGPTIYCITASGSVGTSGSPGPAVDGGLFWTHPTATWQWTCFAWGSSQIYCGGSSGDGMPGMIFRTTTESEGIALQVPVLALPLEGGEIPFCLYNYLNFVFVGTNLGVRMCQTLAAYDPTGNQGDLRAGPLIPNLQQPLLAPCQGLTGSNRWIWFAGTNYDGENSGLWRGDISNFIDTLAPAYASDLMVPRAPITSLDWCWITDSPLISVEGHGIYVADYQLVEEGTVDFGYVSYDIPDDKICEWFDIATTADQQGDVLVSIGLDGGNPQIVGALYEAQGVAQEQIPLGQIRGENIDIRLTLKPNAAGNEGPNVTRATLKALAAVVAPDLISMVLNMHDLVEVGAITFRQDGYGEYRFLKNLYLTQQVVTFQEGLNLTEQVTVNGMDWLANKLRDQAEGGYDSYLIVYLKTVEPS